MRRIRNTASRCALVMIPILLLTLTGSYSGMAQGARRLAFVVGIGEYPNLGENQRVLTRAVQDAKDVAAAFARLGFEIHGGVGLNLSREEFISRWKEFIRSIERGRGDTVAIFLGGHGMQVEARGFLLPSNVPSKKQSRPTELERESISLTEMLLDLKERYPRLGLFIIDACRTNPFLDPSYRTPGLGGVGLTADGLLVVYSASDDQAALDYVGADDTSPNSVFTRALLPLLEELKRPSLPLYREWSQKLQQRVEEIAKSGGKTQSPRPYSGLQGGAFCLLGPCDPNISIAAKWVRPPESVIASAPKHVPESTAPGETAAMTNVGDREQVAGKGEIYPTGIYRAPGAVEISTEFACALQWPEVEKTGNEVAIAEFIGSYRGRSCAANAPAKLEEIIRSKSTLHVIAIGIASYAESARWQPLYYAAGDARAVERVLASGSQTSYRQVSTQVLTDASKARIIDAFSKTKELAQPNDAVIVYLSGHTAQSGGRSYLIPSDARVDEPASWVDLGHLQEMLGTTFGERVFLIDNLGAQLSDGLRTTLIEANRRSQITVISAVSPGQTAFYDASLGHSYFTHALLRGLAGEAMPAGASKVTIADLGRFVRQEVARLSGGRQIPYTISDHPDFSLVPGKK